MENSAYDMRLHVSRHYEKRSLKIKTSPTPAMPSKNMLAEVLKSGFTLV